MKVILIGGGTGGHLFPLVSVAKKLKERVGSDLELLYVGPKSQLEEKIMRNEGIPTRSIMAGKVRRYFSFLTFLDFFKIPIGFFKSLWILLQEMPDVIFSKGGYASIPIALAARIYRIPVLTHESDAIPGIANKVLGKISNRVAISYPKAERYFLSSKVLLTGNPIGNDITSGSRQLVFDKFNFTESKPVILILGGSQGAWAINKAIANVLPEILHVAQVIHQTGEKTYEDTIKLAAEKGVKAGRRGYNPISFIENEDMKHMIVSADLIISRAGANSIAEIAANKKPAILIPLDNSANDHQRMNAYEVAQIGGALVLEENNLGENILPEKIKKILFDDNLKANMGEKIHSFYHPEASDKIVEGIIDLTKK